MIFSIEWLRYDHVNSHIMRPAKQPNGRDSNPVEFKIHRKQMLTQYFDDTRDIEIKKHNAFKLIEFYEAEYSSPLRVSNSRTFNYSRLHLPLSENETLSSGHGILVA